MSDYLLVFRGGDMPQHSPEQMQQHMEKWFSWIKGLREAGVYKGGAPLEAPGKTIRGRSKSVMDGPYAEAKDLVNGYVQVSAKSLDDAAQMSLACPILDVDGSVEVRQVRETNM
jgi:hypothetical protein